MSVNFVQLLQESWNFIRNQRAFTLTAIAVIIAFQLVNLLLASQMPLDPRQATGNAGSSLFIALVLGIFSIYFSLVLLVLNIKNINVGQYRHFFTPVGEAFTKLFPVIGVILLMSFPLSFGIVAAAIGAESGGIGIIALPLLVSGIFIFLKLCLGTYALLIENFSVGQAVKFSWQLTKGKMIWVIGYVLIAYILPMIFNMAFTQAGNSVMLYLSLFISAFLSVFTTVFGFRFYQALRAQ